MVGDTVEDTFKDTSGPALNILIKFMSIISLTIAPLLEENDTWEVWYYGLIPIGLMVFGTYCVYHFFSREAGDIPADVGGGDDGADEEAGKGEGTGVTAEDLEIS